MVINGLEPRFLLVYGTQTGQAKAIAEEIAERAEKCGLCPDLHCFGRVEKEFSIEKESLIVIITSTTGDGEPPDTVQKFWRRIKRRALPSDYLAHLKYALLGLGDSNYSNFCNCAKMMDARLKELGAGTLMNSSFADDATGLEVVVEPWIEDLLAALKKHFSYTTTQVSKTQSVTDSSSEEITEMTAELSMASVKDSESPDCNQLTIKSSATSSTETEISGHSGQDLGNKSVLIEGHELHSLDPDLSITCSDWTNQIPDLPEADLSLPSAPPSYICMSYRDDETLDMNSLPVQNRCKLPFANSEVVELPILAIVTLTKDTAVKKTLHIHLDNQEGLLYEPGDSFSIIPRNDDHEVNWLLKRLGSDKTANKTVELSVRADTTKKRAAVPEFLNNPTTLTDIFTQSLDIRHVPKKALLRLLAKFTLDNEERRQLLTLSSRQGSEVYQRLIMDERRGFLDILSTFKSCSPPCECLIENLPRLLPRPYSVTSIQSSGRLSFAFNVVNMDDVGDLKNRQGLVTGLFDRLSLFPLDVYPRIKAYARSHQNFRLPENPECPLILIGPGTGVAPYISFLKQREVQKAEGKPIGDAWLFFGNRHVDRDFLFKEELDHHLSLGTLTGLYVSFSRDHDGRPRYVTDSLKCHSSKITKAMMEDNGYIYVCGNARNMAKDVLSTVTDIIKHEKGFTADEVDTVMKGLKVDKRYREDVWM